MPLAPQPEDERAEVEEVVVARSVRRTVVGRAHDPRPAEQRPLVVDAPSDDVRAEAVVAAVVLPETEHEASRVGATPGMSRECEAGEVEAEVEADEGRLVPVARLPQEVFAELVPGEHSEVRADLVGVVVNVRVMGGGVPAEPPQVLGIGVVRDDQPFLDCREGRASTPPAHTHVLVAADDEALATGELGLAVENDEGARLVAVSRCLPRRPAVRERPGADGDVEQLGRHHSSQKREQAAM